VLQADAYAGFDQLYGERVKEAACWAHVRRKFYDIHVALSSPIALEARTEMHQIPRCNVNRFRATRFWRTSPLSRSVTSTFRVFIAFRWSAILVGFYPQFPAKRSPPARNDLSTRNRYFWQVSVNTPLRGGAVREANVA